MRNSRIERFEEARVIDPRDFRFWQGVKHFLRGMTLALLFSLLFGVISAAWAEYKGESNSIIGNIEQVSLQKDGRLLIRGWSLDLNSQGGPVVVISVYHENIVFIGTASGHRDDITRAYPLAKTENVVISGTSSPVACQVNQKVITLAANSSREFAIIGRNNIDACP